jgi:hypothetical protein
MGRIRSNVTVGSRQVTLYNANPTVTSCEDQGQEKVKRNRGWTSDHLPMRTDRDDQVLAKRGCNTNCILGS